MGRRDVKFVVLVFDGPRPYYYRWSDELNTRVWVEQADVQHATQWDTWDSAADVADTIEGAIATEVYQ
jgi:hypothetical protein